MAPFRIVLFYLGICLCAAAGLSRQAASQDYNAPTGMSVIEHRDATKAPSSVFKEDFNFTAGNIGREVLFDSEDGLIITCIDCQLEGLFTLEVDSEANDDLLGELRDTFSDIAPLLNPIKNLFGNQDHEPILQQAADTASKLLRSFNLTLTQTSPFRALFNLELVTGNSSIDIELPVIPLSGFPSLPARKIDFGILELDIVLNPLALATTISMQPNANITLPFGAEVNFGRPLQVSQDVFQNASPDTNVALGKPMLNADDPNLCVSVALGPIVSFELRLPPTDIGLNLNASLELPRLSICFDGDKNVDNQCRADGPIANALNLNSSLSIGISSSVGLNLPSGLDIGTPDLPQLPQLSKELLTEDRCIGIGNDTQQANGTQPITIDFAVATSESEAELSTRASSMELAPPPTISVMTTSTAVPDTVVDNLDHKSIVSESDESAPTSVCLTSCSQESVYTTTITTLLPIGLAGSQAANATAQTTNDTNKHRPDVTTAISVRTFDEPVGMVFSLPTGMAGLGRQFPSTRN